MKIKNIDIVNFANGIDSLKDKKLPLKLSFYLNKNIKAIERIFPVYEEERKKIIEKYCVKENGEPVINNGQYEIENVSDLNKDMNELLNLEVDVDITVISEEDVMSIDDSRFDGFTLSEMNCIAFMIQ